MIKALFDTGSANAWIVGQESLAEKDPESFPASDSFDAYDK